MARSFATQRDQHHDRLLKSHSPADWSIHHDPDRPGPECIERPRLDPQVRAFLTELNKDGSPFWELPQPRPQEILTGLQNMTPVDMSGVTVDQRTIEQDGRTVRWVAAHASEIGADGSRIAVAGNSVGGDMTAAIALMAKDRNGPRIRYQVLLIPATNASVDTESYQTFATGRFLPRAFMQYGWNRYAPDAATRNNPYVSPLRASDGELSGLPPALVITAENDPLRDEGEAYARRLTAAGVNVTAIRYNGTIHDFVLLNALRSLPATQAALEQISNGIREHLAGQTQSVRLSAGEPHVPSARWNGARQTQKHRIRLVLAHDRLGSPPIHGLARFTGANLAARASGGFAMLKSLVNLAAAAALFAALGPASAQQIREVDPSTPSSWNEPAASTDSAPRATDSAGVPRAGTPQGNAPEWTPVEGQAPADGNAATAATDINSVPVTGQAGTVPRHDVFNAAEGLFGRGARGLAGILENILRDQGEPIAYISGQEASGAFILGARWGSGTMHHSIEGDRDVYWTGPSVGFDVGGDINKVFVLVYNLNDSQQLFRRYPGGEGHAYFVGGFSATYLRRGNVVLIPVRLGGGLRLGVNVNYMRFSERNRWLPF
jgi:dienelactone hydrolase